MAEISGTGRRAEPLKEFARSFGVSYDTVFRASRDGRLKTIRIGARLYVPIAEAERVGREGLSRAARQNR
jgi:predicted site-specific integrase-resolvase